MQYSTKRNWVTIFSTLMFTVVLSSELYLYQGAMQHNNWIVNAFTIIAFSLIALIVTMMTIQVPFVDISQRSFYQQLPAKNNLKVSRSTISYEINQIVQTNKFVLSSDTTFKQVTNQFLDVCIRIKVNLGEEIDIKNASHFLMGQVQKHINENIGYEAIITIVFEADNVTTTF